MRVDVGIKTALACRSGKREASLMQMEGQQLSVGLDAFGGELIGHGCVSVALGVRPLLKRPG